MGSIYYGGSAGRIQIEDRALAHLKVVIATKLRRNESFTVSWQHPDGHTPGRSTIWLHPAIPLRFVFEDAEPADLNRSWIAELATSSYSAGGITLTAEHIEPQLAATEGTPAPAVSLGAVEVTDLDVGKLTISGKEVTPTPDRP